MNLGECEKTLLEYLDEGISCLPSLQPRVVQ